MREVKFCPNCGSTDVGVDRTSAISLLALDSSYRCGNCGYSGGFPETDPDALDEVRENIEERGPVFEREEATPTFNRGRLALGTLLLILGLTASYSTRMGGLLAGLLAIAIGASIIFEQISKL